MSRLKDVVKGIEPINALFIKMAKERLDNLTKPQGSLGRLEGIAMQVMGITQNEHPRIEKKVIFTMAADHGVTAQGVSAYPRAVTAQMVYNFLNGGAAINVLANNAGARVVVVDMGVAENLKAHDGLIIKKIRHSTMDMSVGPAMTRQEAISSIEAGIDTSENEFNKEGMDIVGLGEMGIGNTTASAAISAILLDLPIEKLAGRGTGIDDVTYQHKIGVIKKAIRQNKPNPTDPLDVLAKVGGFEIGGMAGAMLHGASKRIPVVIDGFISGTAALLAYQIEPAVRDYMIASHCSPEKGHKVILDHLGLEPLLDLHMRLGEGTGAALAFNIIEASIKILTQMATFQDAGVSRSKIV